jgi:hypothetical protein
MLYDLANFQALVRDSQWGYLNERRPKNTCETYGLTDDDVEKILCALIPKDWQKTVPDCRVENAFNGCYFVNADQYSINWHEESKTRRSVWSNETIDFSLKIAIVTDSKGDVAGLVTFHAS